VYVNSNIQSLLNDERPSRNDVEFNLYDEQSNNDFYENFIETQCFDDCILTKGELPTFSISSSHFVRGFQQFSNASHHFPSLRALQPIYNLFLTTVQGFLDFPAMLSGSNHLLLLRNDYIFSSFPVVVKKRI